MNRTQCQVDKNIASQKYISTLIKTITDHNGRKQEIIIKCPLEIDRLIREYYFELYKCKDNQITYKSIDEFLGQNIKVKELGDEDRRELSQPITLEELEKALKNSKKHSSPGPLGFTYNWWRKFWSTMKYLLLATTQSISKLTISKISIIWNDKFTP